jgi:hypothetical protein
MYNALNDFTLIYVNALEALHVVKGPLKSIFYLSLF